MLLSTALKLYRTPPAKAKAASTTSGVPSTPPSKPVMTIDPQTIINFYSVDKETRIFPSDLVTPLFIISQCYS
jgi:hypothetical protein